MQNAVTRVLRYPHPRGIRHQLNPRGIRIALLKAGISACRQYGLPVPDQAANLDEQMYR